MRRKAFLTVYKEYGKHYVAKDYEKCMAVFPQLDLNAHYLQYKEQIDWVLRSACHSLSLIKNPQIQQKVSVANAFNDVFSQLSTTTDYVHFFSLLNAFTNGVTSKGLESYLPLFTNISSGAFDPKSWLQSVNVHLFEALKNAKIIDDHKQTKQREIYLQLTCTLLFFVNVESQRTMSMKKQWQFNESLRFLKNCTNFRLFHEGDTQYSECFKMLSKFLECLCLKAENGEFTDGMQNFLKSLKNLVKSREIRATLVRDIFAVLTRATKMCEQRFDELVNVKNCAIFFDFMAFIGNGITQSKTSKTEKIFLCRCDDTHIHLSHENTMMVINKFIRLLAYGPDIKVAENVGVIVRVNFEAISKLTCTNTKNVQIGATNSVRNLIKTCENKETGQQAVLFLKSLIQRYHRIKLMKEVSNFDEHHLLSYLFKANSFAENWDEAVTVGYLLIAFMSFPEPKPNFEHTAWSLAKIQKEQNNIKSPFDHFNQIDPKSLYGFTLPNNFSLVKLSLTYLKIGMKYGVMSTEFSNKIIHQLLMSASKDDFSPLRFVLFTQSMNFDRITTERVEKLINVWQVKGKTDRSIGLQLAAIKYHKFNFDATEWTEKHKDLHISQALSEEGQALDTNVFKEITFDCEKKQICMLRFIKKKFIEFTEYYVDASDAERTSLEEEKDYLLRDLKMVANQFIVRGYIDDGLDLYMALYWLSIAVDDEFGLIDSCSFFAECSAEFKQKFPFENLKTIVEGCFSKVINKLKILKGLSTRKQNQVGFCMLNLVLYYHEEDGDHSKEIYTILKFIFTSIGGIRDKNMSDCLKATTGASIPTSNAANEPNINSEAVRIKFFTVMFSMVTKYSKPCTFCPSKFLNFVLNHIKKYLNVYSDSTMAVPILLFNIAPQMITWLQSTYEVNINHQSLVLTLLKLAIRSGYGLRAAGLLITLTQASLLNEDLKYCKSLFTALESITLSPSTKTFTVQKDKSVMIAEGNSLCEPIRKQGVIISPMKNATPSPAAGESKANYIKFLREHPNSCDCGICFSPETKFQRFCTAVMYARYVYLNEDEFSKEALQSVFKRLITFWEDNRKDKNKFPRNDMFYFMSARMLLYAGHYFWKNENDKETAVDLLKRGSKGLNKVKYGTKLIKQDLEQQIKDMEDTIKEMREPREKKFLRIQIRFDDESKTNEAPISGSNLRTHGAGVSSLITPNVRKSPRNRLKLAEEVPARTPSRRVKPKELLIASTQVEHPKRNLIPTIYIDLDSDSESKETK